MKVRDVMTPNATAIWITGSLADAAKEMWEHDCGALPVIKDGLKVVGMITDRDICMAVAMRDGNPSSISVEEVMNPSVFFADPDEEIEEAMATMRKHRIRRLPVMNLNDELQGILSMNDIVLKAQPRSGKKMGLEYADVVKTYQAICAHPMTTTQAAAAS